jgi:ADP-ribose pyrophosphatase
MKADVIRFPYTFPADFFDKLGYKPNNRFVAFYWDSGADYLCVCEDGRHETDNLNNGLWSDFFHEMGVLNWLVEQNVNLSTNKEQGRVPCWLVVDMQTKEGFVTTAKKGREIITKQTMDPPPPPRVIKTLGSKVIGRAQIETPRGPKVLLALHELTVEDGGKQRPYFMVTRGEKIVPPAEKKPDAVIVIGIIDDGKERRLVLTNEYRTPIGGREISFPAGLIDPDDFAKANGDVKAAAMLAAKREFMEETGLQFTPTEVSPPNLYSSAGMTNEAVSIVFGTATGTPTNVHCEPGEDIETILATKAEMLTIMADPARVFSKVCWPFLWGFSKHGF